MPSGKIKITTGVIQREFSKHLCDIFNVKKAVTIATGLLGSINLCGDAIVTMKEMGYDFENMNAMKKAKKEDEDKILQKYDQLSTSKPDLFSNEKADALLNKSLKASAAKEKKQQVNELVELKKSYKEQHSKRIKWFSEDLGEGEKVVETVWGSEVTKSDGRKSSFLEGVLHEGIFVATNKPCVW